MEVFSHTPEFDSPLSQLVYHNSPRTPHEARFGGINRLFGANAAERLRTAHVAVVGLGGVGSWTAESLARSGIGELTLIDLDDVCISNVNRQLHAITGQFGKPKVEVMAERIHAINPECLVHARQEFFLASNAADILATRFDYVVDAIDRTGLKCLLIAGCRERGLPVITTGGAGGRRDPTAVEVVDLGQSGDDRLLQQLRKRLRDQHGFPRRGAPFGMECVLSREPMVFPQKDGSVCAAQGDNTDLRIDCNTGFGTASFVTGVFGLTAAARVVHHLSQA